MGARGGRDCKKSLSKGEQSDYLEEELDRLAKCGIVEEAHL